MLARSKAWDAAHKEQVSERGKTYYAANASTIREKRKVYGKTNSVAILARKHTNHVALRAEVFAHYGGKCECCGETHHEFLTMDHVGGGGAEHKRRDKSAKHLYSWLKRHGFPAGFRVLCVNCNMSVHKNHGTCAHRGGVSPADSKSTLSARRTKQRAIDGYGGKCACCGENGLDFLSLDHVDGDGSKHRKLVGDAGLPTYRWTIEHGFPPSLRCLCMNCNISAYRGDGVCIHCRH